MGTESGAGEFSVGSIVWVRRRNGSWWPGKIVGPQELSASHLTSPRSGTPVKLLGREDASVDWYNLEKSKRVKAFRCGDFDDCIRRAECSQGMPIKKREKYARREDAILHALDLEKQQFRKQGKLGIASDCTMNNKSSGSAVKKGLVTPPESLGNNKIKLGNSKLNHVCKTETLDGPFYSAKLREGNQLSGGEDHSEALPRMRGLQDFGLKIAPSKTSFSSFGVSNCSRKPVVDNIVEAPLIGGPRIGGTSHTNGKNYVVDKRKRSHEELVEENLVKRRDKHRPLVQVLQSSVKLEEVPHLMEFDGAMVSTSVSGVLEPVGALCRAKRSRCVYFPTAESSESLDYKAVSHSDIEMSDSQNEPFPHPTSVNKENISGSSEEESDSSDTESTESESDSSETEDMDEDMAAHSDAAVHMDRVINSMGRYEANEHGITDESMLPDDIPHFYSHYPSSAHRPVSKWHLKGKRNIRNLTKRSADIAYPEEKDFRAEMIGLYGERNLVEWDDWNWEDHQQQPSTRNYWDTKRKRFDPVYDTRNQSRGISKSMLIDVELKVQASYPKERVPIVSLMSKLNGKAIIGHLIQIEPLEDGSSSNLVSTVDDFGNELVENDVNVTLPQAWRTARRTANFRVPRPHLSSALDGGDENLGYDFPFLDRENKATLSKKSNLMKRNNNATQFKKVPKKLSLSLSSQKTRTLSSIAIEHSFFGNINKSASRDCGIVGPMDGDDGLLKTESSSGGPTTVACIPLKLVFSRLLEKINRPPSKAILGSSNGALLQGDFERNPS